MQRKYKYITCFMLLLIAAVWAIYVSATDIETSARNVIEAYGEKVDAIECYDEGNFTTQCHVRTVSGKNMLVFCQLNMTMGNNRHSCIVVP